MTLLSQKLQGTAQNVQTTERDSVYTATVATNAYKGKVKMMYLDSATSGALFCNIELDLTVDGAKRTHKETIYISNKEGEVEYTDKKTGDKVPMPGFVMVDTLCKLATGKGIGQLSPEVKQLKVYNPATKQEENMNKEVYTDVIGQDIAVGLFEQTVDKKTKADDGSYVATGETRDENVINKFFNDKGQTINEQTAGAEAGFINTWLENYKGKKFNKAKGATASGAAGAQAGKPATAGANGASGSSLF